jgi:hypothetical protein
MADPLQDNGFSFVLSQDFYLRVALGLVSGYSFVNKFGRNPDLDTGANGEDIWTQGGLYTFLSAAATLYVSSSQGADTQEITVQGLDATWAYQEQTVDLTGQAQAEIGSGLTWLRVFRAFNSDSTPTTGDVYIAETDDLTGGVPDTASKIKAKIDIYAQQTLMAIYTVPLGKTGYLADRYYTLNKVGATIGVNCRVYMRESGGVFRVLRVLGIQSTGTSSLAYKLTFPDRLPAKADVLIRGVAAANDADVSAGFSVLLIDD